jgi:acyl carrier protein
MATIRERTIDIIAEQMGCDRDKINDETTFQDDLGADSLDEVELVMELEEEFDILIADDEAEVCKTVGQAIALLEKRLSPAQSPTMFG